MNRSASPQPRDGLTEQRLAQIAVVCDILDSLHVGTCLFDTQDRALLWNNAFLRLFPEHAGFISVGEPYAENLRRFYRARLGPAEMAAIEQCIAEGIARHRSQSQPFVFQHRGRWVRVASQLVPGLGRMRIWMPIAGPDTTDALPEPGDEGDGRSTLGPEGLIASCNSRFARIFGLVSAAEATGQTHAALVAAAWAKAGSAPAPGPAPAPAPGPAAVLQTLAEGERFTGVPFELALPGERWLRVLQNRLADGRVVSSFADISAMKRLQAELGAAREAADRANHAKDALLATVSHELRTPLNAILGMLSVLEVQPLPAEAVRHVEVALGAARGLLHLVDDVLTFARQEGGAASTTAVEPTDPSRLVREVVQLLTPQAAAKGVRLAAQVAAGVPVLVAVDAARLRQVLVNLVGNAVKFTEHGEIVLQLARAKPARPAEGEVALSFTVSDTGIGIPGRALVAIFEPHVQAGPEIAQRYGGSGLGLSICRTLVRMMGGEIAVTSTLGQGSRFTFDLPCRVLAPAAPAPSDALPALPPLRVLVVDDQPVNREVARILLTQLGLTVTLAGQDAEALRVVAAPCDLLLLDLEMPGLGGIGLLPALRAAAPPGQAMHAIALTGHAGEEYRRLCDKAGFDGFLTKPLSLRGLATMIAAVIQRPVAKTALPFDGPGPAVFDAAPASASPSGDVDSAPRPPAAAFAALRTLIDRGSAALRVKIAGADSRSAEPTHHA